jgi:GNAT-family acetyltransferase (TIGR03103 family)
MDSMKTPVEGPQRVERREALTLRNWGDRPVGPGAGQLQLDVAVACGWGRLIFAHTFTDHRAIANLLLSETRNTRDIAFYIRDPHVVLALEPQKLFLDPSHTYRLWLSDYRPPAARPRGFTIRRLRTRSDAESVNRIYGGRGMVKTHPLSFPYDTRKSRKLTYLLAEEASSGNVIGTVTGVDHVEAFDDPDQGSSLWCLAVDPQTPHPGVGEALVSHLAEYFVARGRAFMDLSVLHDNKQAIALYEKLGFQRVPVFCVKRKNPINEKLFIGRPTSHELNPYAGIIVNEAQRRGIAVDVIDAEHSFFALSLGGRTIRCRESLSDLTTGVAFSICDDKAVTREFLMDVGLSVPDQREAGKQRDNNDFLKKHKRIVVKPAHGEQGLAVTVDVRTQRALDAAVKRARLIDSRVLLEEYVEGEDLRIIVIDKEVVAAAVRRPPAITGTGRQTVRKLIEKLSRRRSAATGGESKIPIDEETERVLRNAGHDLDDVLPPGETVAVRKTANLHTGGTIHDVTPMLHPGLKTAAEEAARAIDIPVVGLDLIVPEVDQDRYVIVEANERPGLANHEPQPTAERFVDLLFPQTIPIS